MLLRFMSTQTIQFGYDKDAVWDRVHGRVSVFLDTNCWINMADGKTEAVRTDDAFYVAFSGPVVVLVNERSASGAEIIAAGLRSNGVASVVGSRTAGCVGIAQPRQMPDDRARDEIERFVRGEIDR